MAYYRSRTRRTSRRPTATRARRRTGYGTSRVRRASRPRSGRGGTVRIEIVQSAMPAARPVIGMKPAAAPFKRTF